MRREGLLRDLKALHHGRGIRRPKVRSWVGPDLMEVLDASAGRTDAELRSSLAQLLTRHSQDLPQDLRHLFQFGLALRSDLPMLEARLELAAKSLDRSVRVVRRRLRDAEAMVADSLLRCRPEAPGWWDAQGWQWLAVGGRLVLRTDAVLTLDQEVLALTAQPAFVHEMFTIPGLADDEEPVFEAASGVTVVQVERTSRTGWRVSMELPAGLTEGETVPASLRVRVPRVSALQPYLAFAPVRETPSLSVEVDFGDAMSWWVLDGVLPSDLGPAGTMAMPVDTATGVGLVRVAFDRPRVGLAYGIAWRPTS